jgi:hypothetical protein
VSLETYCLNSGKAAPSTQETYRWKKAKPDLPYYAELLELRRQQAIQQSDLQELLWNLGNRTRWDSYPSRYKAILEKIDPQAALKLPSSLKDQATDFLKSAIGDIPGASDALDTYDLVQGKYYALEDFKRSVENMQSHYGLGNTDNLTQIPDTELYSQSESHGYSGQDVVLYNPSDTPQELDLTKYYLVPDRSDVQAIGINPRSGNSALLTDLEKLLFESMAKAGIGFTPVLGDVSDLYEAISGKDFLSGKPLSADERLASAVGIVLGSGSAYRYAKRWVNAPLEYLPRFESEIARVGSKAVGKVDYAATRVVVEEAKSTAQDLTRRLNHEGAKELSRFLRDVDVHRMDRVQTIQSFVPGTIEKRVMSADEIVYRWHNDNLKVQQFGRYVTPDNVQDAAAARSRLALPDRNEMLRLDSFVLRKGTHVFEGQVAPAFGHQGGGRQILIPGNLNESMIFHERIK